MDASSIRKIIETEIGDDWSRLSPHGIDLKACLVEPTLQSFKSQPEGASDWELWLVLEENPITRSGYKIAYDPEDRQFCLAYGSQPGASYVGHYGSFLDALGAM